MHGFLSGPRPRRGAVALAVVCLLLASGPLHAQGLPAGRARVMSDAQIARWVKDFRKSHPAVGRLSPQDAPVDTFFATGFQFDGDHNLATQVDTIHIHTSQTVLWHALDGSHTVTYGTGSSDPDVGLEFDTPISSPDSPDFSFTFQFPGEYDFFCRVHEGFNMKGVVIVSDTAAADTFLASGTTFETDNNLATQVDTSFITTGQSILWLWKTGIHTVTSGTGSADPNVGKLFDVDLDSADQVFLHQFNQPGIYPFFCRVHEGFNMKGVVVVTAPVSVTPGPGGKQIGFISEPEPNPTTGHIAFRLAMPTAGRATVRVFGARGQLVAVPFDRDMGAGAFNVSWDGSRKDGGPVASGVYYLRVTLPGYRDSRSVVMTH